MLAEPAPSPSQQIAEVPAPVAGGWAVQVAALSSGDAAAKLAADLKAKGYSAFVLEHRADGRVFYRVRVGPESKRERADALAAFRESLSKSSGEKWPLQMVEELSK